MAIANEATPLSSITSSEPATGPRTTAQLGEHPIVLYDGNCGLCDRSVKWILKHERDHELCFAPLQGETAAALRAMHPEIPDLVESVVLVEHGMPRLRTKAIFYIARHLRRPWRWLYRVRWLPASLLDVGYRLIARVRYRIWGTADACELPSPAQRTRFLP